MTDFTIQGPTGAAPLDQPARTAPQKAAGGDRSFGEALLDALESVDTQQKEATRGVAEHLAGDGSDLHTVMLELEKADLAFRTMMEVRSKLINAYREVMRMPM
jgi:flagellar hook-basal body complex protein FliE